MLRFMSINDIEFSIKCKDFSYEKRLNTMNDLKPFNEFWINCFFNAYFSLLTSRNSSYFDAAYMNCYSYISKVEKTPFTNVKYIQLYNSDKRQINLFTSNILTKPIEFRKHTDMVEKIIEFLKNNYIFVGVDLYNWIPNSICWQRRHWEHYSLIKEYDDCNDEFIVFDENHQGYGIYRIPMKRFIDSVNNSPLKDDGFIIVYNDYIEDYYIDYKEVQCNADRLIQELIKLIELPSDYWVLSKQDMEKGYMFDLLSMYAFQIANRHMANIKLMDRLKHLNYIDMYQYKTITEMFKELANGWDMIKSKFIKGDISIPRKLDSDNLNDLKDNLLRMEIETWKYLLSII